MATEWVKVNGKVHHGITRWPRGVSTDDFEPAPGELVADLLAGLRALREQKRESSRAEFESYAREKLDPFEQAGV